MLNPHAYSLIGSFFFDDGLLFAQDPAYATAEGYLIAAAPLVSRLKEEIAHKHTPSELQSLDNLNFYSVLNLSSSSIRLESAYWYLEEGSNTEKHAYATLPLTPQEKDALRQAMDAYSVKAHGKDCTGMLNTIRNASGLALLPEEPLQHSEIRHSAMPLSHTLQHASEKAAAQNYSDAPQQNDPVLDR